MTADPTLRRIEGVVGRPGRAVVQARLWGLRVALEREWDGADPGVETDLEALRLAAEVFEAIDPPETSEPGRLAPAGLGTCTESLRVAGPPRGDR